MSSGRFSHKVAIVTGAGRGMGREIALKLASEGGGGVVAGLRAEWANRTVADIATAGGTALAVAADVSKEEQVATMVQQAVAQYGTVDILVNNAGILGNTQPIEKIPGDEWDRLMAINVKGTFNC